MASTLRSSFQQVRPPFLAAAVVDFPETQVRINFNGLVRHGQEDRTVVAGAKGTLRAYGPSLNEQRVSVWTEAGRADVPLRGCWFDAGFQGSMGELLLAIERGRREPRESSTLLRGHAKRRSRRAGGAKDRHLRRANR